MAASPMMQRLQKLPTRQKVLGAVAVVMALVGGWYMLIYKPKKEDLAKYTEEVKQQQTLVQQLQVKLDNFIKLKTEVESLRAKANVTVVLPSRAELPAFFDSLQSDSTLAGVQIVKWENQPEVPFSTVAVAPAAPPPGGAPAPVTPAPGTPGAPNAAGATLAIKVPVAIVVTGTFQQINRYFYAIYGGNSPNPTDKRMISIEALTIRPILNQNQLPTGQLAAGFMASTFRQPDAPPPPPGGAPAAPGAAAPAGGSKADVADKMEK